MLQEEMQTIRFLHETRHVQKLDVLMDQSSPNDTLDDGDRQFLAKVRKDLARWKEIEEVHGRGSCLRLDHPAVQRVKLMSPHVRLLPEEFFLNAERFSVLTFVAAVGKSNVISLPSNSSSISIMNEESNLLVS